MNGNGESLLEHQAGPADDMQPRHYFEHPFEFSGQAQQTGRSGEAAFDHPLPGQQDEPAPGSGNWTTAGATPCAAACRGPYPG